MSRAGGIGEDVPVDPDECRTAMGSFLASSKLFVYTYGTGVLSNMTWSEGTALEVADGTAASSGLIKGASSAA